MTVKERFKATLNNLN